MNTIQSIVEACKTLSQAIRVEIIAQLIRTLDHDHTLQVRSAMEKKIALDSLQERQR